MKKFAALIAVFALICFAAPALAANPFMDVPMNHWAYDAVSQLASRGVVSGYPDGAFKGEWKATRYEMASVVARALAYVDMNKASKQDLELLKRLVVEFKDELDALGVKVDELDARVAVLESDIGGWALSGQFRFDAKWVGGAPDRFQDDDDDDDEYVSPYGLTGDTDFGVSRYRLWITKRIDDKVKFIGRVGGNTLTWERYYLSVTMPWDATMWVGKWNFDWEGEDGLYGDNDAWFTDQTLFGFYLAKPFGMGQFDVFVAHNEDAVNKPKDNNESYYYGTRLKFSFNEQFGMGLVGIWKDFDDVLTNNWDWATYWVQAYVHFTPDITLKGRYILQDRTDGPLSEEDGGAWQVILDVKQEAFGFTSLWIEYASFGKGFLVDTSDPYANYGADVLFGVNPGVGGNFHIMEKDTTALFVRLDQQWNDKWATFQRYVKVDADERGVTNWTVGVKYWYTPALSFELAYDNIDYDNCPKGREDDHLIRLRTFVSF